jgi:hypothetical protein
MPVAQLPDKEIEDLVGVPKPLPPDYRSRLRTRARPYSSQHEEAQIEIGLQDTGTFRIILRKNRINPLDFSVILGYVPPERIKVFRLRRYNGVHRHTNKLESNSFRDFHIHYATQRYQEAGWDIDAYAESTDRYDTVDGALETLLDDCNFIRPEREKLQPKLL